MEKEGLFEVIFIAGNWEHSDEVNVAVLEKIHVIEDA